MHDYILCQSVPKTFVHFGTPYCVDYIDDLLSACKSQQLFILPLESIWKTAWIVQKAPTQKTSSYIKMRSTSSTSDMGHYFSIGKQLNTRYWSIFWIYFLTSHCLRLGINALFLVCGNVISKVQWNGSNMITACLWQKLLGAQDDI